MRPKVPLEFHHCRVDKRFLFGFGLRLTVRCLDRVRVLVLDKSDRDRADLLEKAGTENIHMKDIDTKKASCYNTIKTK